MVAKQFSAVRPASSSLNSSTTSAIGFASVEMRARTTSSTLLFPEAKASKPVGRDPDGGGGGGEGGRTGGILEGGFLGRVGRLESNPGAGAGTGKGVDDV